jgi:hypothetical protein
MSQECVEKFIGRLITDDGFREDVRICFRTACREQGFVFSVDEGEALKDIDYDLFAEIATEIDGSIKRCS